MPSRHYYGIFLTLCVIALSVIGVLNLYSASAEHVYFQTQLRHLILGLLTFIVFGWVIPIRLVNTYAYVFLLGILISLSIVLILGHTAGGAQRWLTLGPIRFQPSELAKLAVCIGIAKFFFIHRHFSSFSIKDIGPVLFGLCALFILIFKQPDFGTAGICVLIGLMQLAFVPIRMGVKLIVGAIAGVSVLGLCGWLFFLRPYQKLRILNLLNPNMDPTGSGYNSLQSLVAVGSGQVFGKGFLQGTQTQLQFLPARHTDFIFSVFAEEHGFWGCVIVFLLFSAISYIALEIARDARDCFSSLLAIGISGFIFVEFTINVAMVLGLFPVVGMPLPFFSFGGSALITTCLALGMLVAIERDTTKTIRGGSWN